MDFLSYKNKKSGGLKRNSIKTVAVLLLVLCFTVGYFLYNHYYVSASVSANKYLINNNSTAVNSGSTESGGFADTAESTGDGTYWQIRESSDTLGGLDWNFMDWNALNITTETTGPKVVKVVVYMRAGVGNSTWNTNGNKTFRFRMYNYNRTPSADYDLNTTTTQQLNTMAFTNFALEFPVQDYTNYFNSSGNFRIQLQETADGDTFRTRMRIDYFYVKIYYDKTAPTATWVSPTSNNGDGNYYTNAANVSLQASGTDNSDAEQTGISGMRFYYGSGTSIGTKTSVDSGGTIYNGAWTYTWSSPAAGVYTSVYAMAYDGKSNISTKTSTQTIVVDRTNPTATLTLPGTNAVVSGAAYNITGTASDTNISSYVLEHYKQGTGPWTNITTVNNTSVTAGTLNSWDTTSVTDGIYDIRLTVTDKAGNSSTATKTGIKIDNNAPTVILLM
jgi:hypothetical protein